MESTQKILSSVDYTRFQFIETFDAVYVNELLCLSHTTVVLDVGRLVLGMAFLHASFSLSLLGNLNTLSLFSSFEFPVHLGTQHLLTIVLFSNESRKMNSDFASRMFSYSMNSISWIRLAIAINRKLTS